MKKKDMKKLIVLVILLLSYAYTTFINTENKNQEEPIKERKTEDVIFADENTLNVYFIDVGQADSILLENKGHYMLIDAGNNEDGPKLVNYFNEQDIKEFDYVVGTHAHEDHIGGMDDIIKNFKIDNFYMPDAITTTKTFEDVLDALEETNVIFQTPKVNQTFNLQDTTITTLSVTADEKNLNDTSIVLKVKHGTNTFLFMGDASTKIEKNLLNKDIKSDVLKVGHHGSRYSTSLEFLKKVSPEYAVISVGENNTYKHPHEEILKRLEEQNIQIYRTDKQGTILAKSNGSIITFSTIKTDTNG
ncbi:beta-lactamase domain protein [Mycoplasma sp. CAG:877]|nr:beta-lactamase domain protein [Mycoplasma sp. CAG:877]